MSQWYTFWYEDPTKPWSARAMPDEASAEALAITLEARIGGERWFRHASAHCLPSESGLVERWLEEARGANQSYEDDGRSYDEEDA